MLSQRTKNLDTLTIFIEQLKNLRTRAKSDIEVLRSLQFDETVDPGLLLGSITGLGDQVDTNSTSHLLENIDWREFADKDTTPLEIFTQDAHKAYADRNTPSVYQRSPLSELQKFVKQARLEIVDPVLARFPEDGADLVPQKKKPKRNACRRTTDSETTALSIAVTKPERTRRMSTRLQDQNRDRNAPLAVPSCSKSCATATTISENDPSESHPPTVLGKRARRHLWSASELNSLDRLLEEIPKDTLQRYEKISLAMHGNRTAKQISDRVHKYHETSKISTRRQGTTKKGAAQGKDKESEAIAVQAHPPEHSLEWVRQFCEYKLPAIELHIGS
ncbi:hypothetical protein C8R43DRAFT_1235968 [Mycena crocata]|nr:hypothetical protein C8R43DRAFT_1235968 [Mycena crocata]